MSILKGKKGLIMGVANERSIAWGIAKTLANNGAELAFSFQNEGFKKRLIPLMNSINSEECFERPSDLIVLLDLLSRSLVVKSIMILMR